MRQRLWITATDTEVGKTQVTAALASWLTCYHPEVHYELWKPVQTGTQLGQANADSHRLYRASHGRSSEHELVSYTYPDPLAPWIAAEYQNDSIDVAKLVREGQERSRTTEKILVEGAGGMLVPLTDEHTFADLAAALELECCIVARPGLGTVNHSLLTIKQAQQAGLQVRGVIFNGCPDLDAVELRQNKRMIEQFSDVPVLGMLPRKELPAVSDADWREWRRFWAETVDRELDTARIFPDL